MANPEKLHEVTNPQWLVWRTLLSIVMVVSVLGAAVNSFRASASMSLDRLDVAEPSDAVFVACVVGFVGSLIGLAITTPKTIVR